MLAWELFLETSLPSFQNILSALDQGRLLPSEPLSFIFLLFSFIIIIFFFFLFNSEN